MSLPWTDTEPVDIDGNMEEVTTVEINEYEVFCRQKLDHTKHVRFNLKGNFHKRWAISHNFQGLSTSEYDLIVFRDRTIQVKPITMLTPQSAARIGPQQTKLYAALSTTMASDALDMERLESLGDSYLKFAASLYLFCTLQENEGVLTQVCLRVVAKFLYATPIKLTAGRETWK